MSDEPEDDDDWSKLWDARLAAMERVLGKSHDQVFHGTIPFQFGAEMGGMADIVMFKNHVDGTVYVTADLVGCEDQQPNAIGNNYELMVCEREDTEWGPWIIGQLAHFTLQAALEPGETMALGDGVPEGATISAFLFDKYASFDVLGEKTGLLLCLGITEAEAEFCHEHGHEPLIKKLKDASIYPFSDVNRKSVV